MWNTLEQFKKRGRTLQKNSEKRGKEETHVKSSFPPLFITELKAIKKKTLFQGEQQISKPYYCSKRLVLLIAHWSTADSITRPSVATPAEIRNDEKDKRRAISQSEQQITRPHYSKKGTGSPHYPAVTVDTAAKPSTAAPDVRKHEKKQTKN
jgi:hypothetical protein